MATTDDSKKESKDKDKVDESQKPSEVKPKKRVKFEEGHANAVKNTPAETQGVEKRIVDLQQACSDLAVLVNSHGEVLNNIESQVSTTAYNVQQCNDALVKVEKTQKKSKKWTCIVISIVIIVVITAALAYLLTRVLLP